ACGKERRVSLSMAMRILLGGDHAGFDLKRELKDHLEQSGFDVEDVGTLANESVDYPEFAHKVADGVSDGSADLGIVICGRGNGVNISANKHNGVRSALAWNATVAALVGEPNIDDVVAMPRGGGT